MSDKATGRVTVGVTEEGSANLASVMDTPWFDQEKDAFLVAVSCAIAQGLDIGTSPLRGTKTKFNVGTIDADGSLRRLVRSLTGCNENEIYDFSERLADAGLVYLKAHLVDGGATLPEALFGAVDQDGS